MSNGPDAGNPEIWAYLRHIEGLLFRVTGFVTIIVGAVLTLLGGNFVGHRYRSHLAIWVLAGLTLFVFAARK